MASRPLCIFCFLKRLKEEHNDRELDFTLPDELLEPILEHDMDGLEEKWKGKG